MILGIYDPNQAADVLQGQLQVATAPTKLAQIWADDGIALAWAPTGIASLDEPDQPYRAGFNRTDSDRIDSNRADLAPGDLQQTGQTVSVFEGKLYNLAEIGARLDGEFSLVPDCSGQAIGELYERYGEDFLAQVNGKFAFALWDGRSRKLILGRDRLGIQFIV